MTSGNKGVQVLLEYRFGICLVMTKRHEILENFVSLLEFNNGKNEHVYLMWKTL